MEKFDWRQLGKADYSQACALVASLPSSVRNKLAGLAKEVLCRVTYYVWKSTETKQRWRGLAQPSEKYLASKINRSVRTVRRCLSTLRRYGLLIWMQQKGKYNEWLTNSYALGKTFLASLYARIGKKVQQIHRGTKMAHYNLKKGIEAAPSPTRAASLPKLADILRDKLALKGIAPAPDVAWDS